MNISDKTIVVTGCTKGIGKAVVLEFAKLGYSIAGCARNEQDINALANEIAKITPDIKHIFIAADVSDKSSLTAFTDSVRSTFSSVNILVNNAGVFLPGKLIEEEEGKFELVMQTNIYSAYYTTRHILPLLLKADTANIFNICSIAGLQAYDGGGSYAVSKFAMLGFSKQLRHELKKTHVKVTAIMPGATLTHSWNGIDLPESRFIKPEDISKTIKNVVELSANTDIEEIVIRPQEGDI
ncbi:MAG: SDR family oxidoreductase [Bacteroidia bacterium]|jgi:NADP-dependent 3-hydroxy acid dehydrogenase YdfG|nr:SDR family oxidoreductase [Bacteroidia bacterium]